MRLATHNPAQRTWPKRWLPVAAWCALIFFLSHQTKADFASVQPSGITQTPASTFLGINADVLVGKSAHIFLFGVLAALLWRATGSNVLTLLLVLFYGVLDEWHQSFVPGRTPRLTDVGFDVAGALIALVICWALWGRFRPKTTS